MTEEFREGQRPPLIASEFPDLEVGPKFISTYSTVTRINPSATDWLLRTSPIFLFLGPHGEVWSGSDEDCPSDRLGSRFGLEMVQ